MNSNRIKLDLRRSIFLKWPAASLGATWLLPAPCWCHNVESISFFVAPLCFIYCHSESVALFIHPTAGLSVLLCILLLGIVRTPTTRCTRRPASLPRLARLAPSSEHSDPPLLLLLADDISCPCFSKFSASLQLFSDANHKSSPSPPKHTYAHTYSSIITQRR